MKRFGFLLLTGLIAFSGAASAKDTDKPPADPSVTGPASESKLIHDVRHKLVELSYYSVFDDLAFTVDGSTVTLVGQVVLPVLKDDAGKVVKDIEGVTNVINKLEVLPLSSNDDRIRMNVYRAIYGDSVLSTRYGLAAVPSIHIIVKNGNVRLTGVVADEMDRNLSGIRANGVSGVFSVRNELRIEAK